jgi:hypothetical protein
MILTLKVRWIDAIKNTNVSKVIVVDDGEGEKEDDCNNKIINYKEFVKEAKSNGKH